MTNRRIVIRESNERYLLTGSRIITTSIAQRWERYRDTQDLANYVIALKFSIGLDHASYNALLEHAEWAKGRSPQAEDGRALLWLMEGYRRVLESHSDLVRLLESDIRALDRLRTVLKADSYILTPSIDYSAIREPFHFVRHPDLQGESLWVERPVYVDAFRLKRDRLLMQMFPHRGKRPTI
jgi:hypothetical protein